MAIRRGLLETSAWLSTPPTDTTSWQIDAGISQLADMLVLHGRVDEARVVLERFFEERGDRPLRMSIARLGVIAGMQGDRQRALEMYQDFGAQPSNWPWRQVVWRARIAASLGEIDKATALLREAVGEGWPVMAIHNRPLLSRVLRDHPPFQELIRPKG